MIVVGQIGSRIGGGDQPKWALDLAYEMEFPLPLTSLVYEQRKLSRHERNEPFAINAALRRSLVDMRWSNRGSQVTTEGIYE